MAPASGSGWSRRTKPTWYAKPSWLCARRQRCTSSRSTASRVVLWASWCRLNVIRDVCRKTGRFHDRRPQRSKTHDPGRRSRCKNRSHKPRSQFYEVAGFLRQRDGRATMLIGYARVSTGDQKLRLQRDALTDVGCESSSARRSPASARPSRRESSCSRSHARAMSSWSGSSTASAAPSVISLTW